MRLPPRTARESPRGSTSATDAATGRRPPGFAAAHDQSAAGRGRHDCEGRHPRRWLCPHVNGPIGGDGEPPGRRNSSRVRLAPGPKSTRRPDDRRAASRSRIDQVDEVVVPQHMSQLVGQERFQLIGRNLRDQARRQEDDGLGARITTGESTRADCNSRTPRVRPSCSAMRTAARWIATGAGMVPLFLSRRAANQPPTFQSDSPNIPTLQTRTIQAIHCDSRSRVCARVRRRDRSMMRPEPTGAARTPVRGTSSGKRRFRRLRDRRLLTRGWCGAGLFLRCAIEAVSGKIIQRCNDHARDRARCRVGFDATG